MEKTLDQFIADLQKWEKAYGKARSKSYWSEYVIPVPFSAREVARAIIQKGLGQAFINQDSSGHGPFLIQAQRPDDLGAYEVFDMDRGIRDLREGFSDFESALIAKIDRHLLDLKMLEWM